jgi:hypothetical protein
LIDLAYEFLSITPESVIEPGKERRKVKVRRLIFYWAANELGAFDGYCLKKAVDRLTHGESCLPEGREDPQRGRARSNIAFKYRNRKGVPILD